MCRLTLERIIEFSSSAQSTEDVQKTDEVEVEDVEVKVLDILFLNLELLNTRAGNRPRHSCRSNTREVAARESLFWINHLVILRQFIRLIICVSSLYRSV